MKLLNIYYFIHFLHLRTLLNPSHIDTKIVTSGMVIPMPFIETKLRSGRSNIGDMFFNRLIGFYCLLVDDKNSAAKDFTVYID